MDNGKKTLTVSDSSSGYTYLVDSGAEVSYIPASARDRKSLFPNTPLMAANGSRISTWGKKDHVIHIGPRK